MVVVVAAFVVGVDGAAPPPRRWCAPERGRMRAAARAASLPRWVAGALVPAVATSSAMRPSETARMTHQLGRPRASRERQTFRSFWPSAKHGHGHTIRTRHALRTRRSDAQAPLTAVTPGVEGAAVASGQGAQLRDGVTQDMVGVEDLHVVRLASPRGADR